MPGVVGWTRGGGWYDQQIWEFLAIWGLTAPPTALVSVLTTIHPLEGTKMPLQTLKGMWACAVVTMALVFLQSPSPDLIRPETGVADL